MTVMETGAIFYFLVLLLAVVVMAWSGLRAKREAEEAEQRDKP